jgi:hypothetical protein
VSFISKLKIKWTQIETKFGRERAIIGASVLCAIILALWIAHSEPIEGKTEAEELGVVIPKGQLIVPLEMANSAALNGLITRTAVIDLFKAGEPIALVEGLRVLKLSAGEGPLFGALIPEKMAGQLQDIFANPKLRGAIKTNLSGPTQFHLHFSQKTTVVEIPTGE